MRHAMQVARLTAASALIAAGSSFATHDAVADGAATPTVVDVRVGSALTLSTGARVAPIQRAPGGSGPVTVDLKVSTNNRSGYSMTVKAHRAATSEAPGETTAKGYRLRVPVAWARHGATVEYVATIK